MKTEFYKGYELIIYRYRVEIKTKQEGEPVIWTLDEAQAKRIIDRAEELERQMRERNRRQVYGE